MRLCCTPFGSPSVAALLSMYFMCSRLRKILSGIWTDATERADVIVSSGDPIEVIRNVADEGCYDLIVMGKYGRRNGVSTGSVTVGVSQAQPCPVIPVWEAPDAQ